MIKRILVALSGTPFTHTAIKLSVALARRHDAELTGVTVLDLAKLANVGPVPVGGGAAAHELVEHRLQLTQQHVESACATFESECAAVGLRHSVIHETGDAFDRLISVWRYHDLTVAGLRGLFEYGVVHNPDDALVRLISKGVRPIVAAPAEFRDVKRVLLTYNGSMESAKAIKQFVQMRPWGDVDVKLTCFEIAAEKAKRLLDDASCYCRAHGLEPEQEYIMGHPRDRLLEHARHWSADLIVMGSSSRARIFKHLLGDTALHAVRHAEVPLFLSQ